MPAASPECALISLIYSTAAALTTVAACSVTMSAISFEALRTAKAALDEKLITQDDYDAVKESVLRAQGSILQAQQIKAGLDAGIIPEEELANVKRAFLNSLSIQSGIPSAPTAPGSRPGASGARLQQGGGSLKPIGTLEC